MNRFLSVIAVACLGLVATSAARALAPGTFALHAHDGVFDLEANQANVEDVLRELEKHVPAGIRNLSAADRKVSVRYTAVTLDELLSRLRINYVLTYERDENGGTRLADALLFNAEQVGREPELLRKIARLIANLADDDTPFNAEDSWLSLLKVGEAAVPALERALTNNDYQTRQMAASVLMKMGEKYTPGTSFIETVVEGMKDDEYPSGKRPDGSRYYIDLRNARRAYEYFSSHPERLRQAEHLLARQLASPDGQQRLLCASLLAKAGKTHYASALVRVLAPHLRDNAIWSDGALAARALYKLGPSVRPYLLPYLDSKDPQQARMAGLVIHHLDHPGATPVRQALGNSYKQVHDPVLGSVNLCFNGWDPENFPDLNGRYRPQPTPPEPSLPTEELAWTPGVYEHLPPEPLPSQHAQGTGTGDSVEGEDATGPLYYSALPGDTLDDIAKLFLVSVEFLAAVNSLPPTAVLTPGTKLLIPPPGL